MCVCVCVSRFCMLDLLRYTAPGQLALPVTFPIYLCAVMLSWKETGRFLPDHVCV